jgi:parallel beta-helix repeat protein
MSKSFCTVLGILLFSMSTHASTYYVDQVNGNNSGSGLSEASAWKTITKVNSFSFQPGDNVLFRCGQTWREKLNLTKSGSSSSYITIASYGSGDKPVISGADIISGLALYSGNIWKKSVTITYSQQLFFNSIRGTKKSSVSELSDDKDWYYNTSEKAIYIYSLQDPSLYDAPGIEASSRDNAIYVSSSYVNIRDLQVEKTSQSGIILSGTAGWVNIDNFIIYQWTNEENNARSGIILNGDNCSVKNSTFGKKTGDDVGDQNWAGYIPVIITGSSNEIDNNNLYHNSTENENKNGTYAYGIKITAAPGTLKIHDNYIFHTGSNAIYITGYSLSGDVYEIYNNTIEFSGQAGISLYKTRGDDGIGGTGYVYRNRISYANRLGGDIGGNGNQAAGIHFNDGVRSGTSASKPYMKWYCYENNVSNSQALKVPNGQDSDGIALDFNANNVEVFRNILHDNYGKGLYIWNANNCKVYYNIIYGNDAGSTVTAQSSGGESTNNNEFYNNTYYKNYNGNDKGPNYNTEIYFGGYGNNNIFRNNIIYASANGFGYYFSANGTTGCVTDNNIVFSEAGAAATIAYDTKKGRQTFTQWRNIHPEWDAASVNADPLFVNADAGNFMLKSESPAINKGVDLGLNTDYSGNRILDIPDIGAFEITDNIAPVLQSVQIVDEVTLIASFSEKVNITDIQNPVNYFINGEVVIKSAAAQSTGTDVILTTSPHSTGSFTLHANNIKDYSGNLINPAYSSASYSYTAYPVDSVIKLSAESAQLSGSAALKTQAGSLGNSIAYFSGINGAISFKVNIPKAGNWYLWGRLYYSNISKNNSLFVSANNGNTVLGDDSAKYNRWHYDGFNHNAVYLGNFLKGDTIITISPREPGETVLLDQILLTMNSSFIPADEPSVLPVLLNSPENNITGINNNPLFKWSRDLLAQKYMLQVSAEPLFQNTLSYEATDTLYQVNGLLYSGIYYWRVKSIGGGIESDWSEIRTFKCLDLTAPLKYSPGNNTQNQQLQTDLKWNKNVYALSYILQVAEDEGFTSLILSDSTIIDTLKTINNLSYNKTYYWRVSSKAQNCKSNWSDAWSFTTKTLLPALQADPADGESNMPLFVKVNWNKNSEASNYWIQAANDSTFNSLIVNEPAYNDTSLTITSLQYGSKYYWRVLAKNGEFKSDWSPVWSFSCKTLTVSGQALPVNNATDQNLSLPLTWNKNKDASSYDLQVSSVSSFDSLIINESSIGDTSRIISSLQYGGTYFWRIRCNDNSFSSNWSEAWKFTCKILNKPLQVMPLNNTADLPLSITLNWHKIPDASLYHVYVSSDSQFNNIIYKNESVSDTTLVLPLLEYGNNYFWKIRACDKGFAGEWSQVWLFKCKNLLASVQSAPDNNAINLSPEVALSWKKNIEARNYGLQVSEDSLFSSFVVNDSSLVDTVKNITGLKYGSRYFWRINSKDNSVISAWSNTWNFTCRPIAGLLSPLNNAQYQPVSNIFKWNKSKYGNTVYIFQLSESDNFTGIVICDTIISDTSKSINTLSYNKNYFWKVKFISGQTESEWSETRLFSTMPIIKPAGPENNAAGTTLTPAIKWFAEKSAATYWLQVSRSSDFTSFVINDSLLTDTLVNVSSLQYSCTYFWRVKYKNSYVTGDWSPINSFTTMQGRVFLFSGMNGTLSGDVRLGTMAGMKSSRALYFIGTAGGSTFNISLPDSGKWYLWARMYYASSGGKNSFFATVNGKTYILGDDDAKYNKWHWDGYLGLPINLVNTGGGNVTVKISGREPGLTLWLDQFILTNDANYNPNMSQGKVEEILTDVNDQDKIPSEFGLCQNFPNPFNPTTTIRFSLPKEEYTMLKVYNILGEEVKTLVSENLAAGVYNIPFDASDLASGIYIYRIKAGNFVKTSKMQLLK